MFHTTEPEKTVRFVHDDTQLYKSVQQNNRTKYLYAVIVRGEENPQVKLLELNRPLHQTVISGVVENQIKPSGVWYKILCWLAKIPLVKKFIKVPSGKAVIDHLVGYDFVIRKTTKNGFPSFETSGFIKKSCRLGSDSQIEKWKTEAKTLFSSI